MQVNPKILKQKFEKSMPKYDANAIVQREMAERLVALLSQNCGKKFARILELGSGTGVLTKLIERNLDYDFLTCNDIVEKSRFYLENLGLKFDFILGNSAKIKPNGHPDLIISNAMFQWFADLAPVLQHYSRVLNSDGVLAFSTFSTENFKEIRDVLGVSLNYLNIEQIQEVLHPNFDVVAIEEFERVLEFSSPLELLAHLKNTGVNSISSGKMTFAQVKDFCDKISTENGKCSLTYAPVLVIAKKK